MQRNMGAVIVMGLVMGLPLAAGEKKKTEPGKKDAPIEYVINGELVSVDLKDSATQSYCKTYTFKMEKDKTYHISLTGNGFQPYLRLENAAASQVAAGAGLPATMMHKAAKTEEYTIVATSQGNGVGKFTLTIRDASLSTILTVTDKLNQNDAAYQGRKHKLFPVDLEAGKTYQIDMRSTQFDSYLFFESPGKKLLAQDDDSGGYPNARITYKATETGKFRIIASHFGGGGNLGEFTITVMLTDGAPPKKQDDVKKDK